LSTQVRESGTELDQLVHPVPDLKRANSVAMGHMIWHRDVDCVYQLATVKSNFTTDKTNYKSTTNLHIREYERELEQLIHPVYGPYSTIGTYTKGYTKPKNDLSPIFKLNCFNSKSPFFLR